MSKSYRDFDNLTVIKETVINKVCMNADIQAHHVIRYYFVIELTAN
ncbi:hypothetical protein CZ794_00545 [Psychrobacter sp. JB385]|nr:hypothetical protein CZ794_00545 [Psychrobacter sp. JB385]